MEVTRFAPSPNGPLHLGHAYVGDRRARSGAARGGRFLLRIEDIDGAAAAPRAGAGIPRRPRLAGAGVGRSARAIDAGWRPIARRPSACARTGCSIRAPAPARDRRAAASGRTARSIPAPAAGGAIDPAGAAWRLDVAAALALTGPLDWHDETRRDAGRRPGLFGDPVLVRKDAPGQLSPRRHARRCRRRGHAGHPRAATCSPRPMSTACSRRCSGCRCRAGTTTRCWSSRRRAQARQAARLGLRLRWPTGAARARTARRSPRPCARTASQLAFRSAAGLDSRHEHLPHHRPRPPDGHGRRLAGARDRRLPAVAPRRYRRRRRTAEDDAAHAEQDDVQPHQVPGAAIVVVVVLLSLAR